MITQNEFIKSVGNRKVKIQGRFTQMLRLLNLIFPVRIKYETSKIAKFTYLTICRKNSFDMVAASLYSLLKYSSIIPDKIVVVSDGTWKNEEGIKYFRKRGLNVECVDWQICSSFYLTSCPALSKWAEGHIWGKKMAAILYFSEKDRVLFSDPDILWFNTPLSLAELEHCHLKLSVDNSHNYDDKFIEKFNFDRLWETKEPINCGAVYIHGGLKLLSSDALKCIKYEAEHCGKFAEQTVFAIMDLDYNNHWSMQQITSEISDLLTPFFSKTIKYNGMVARHYLWRLKWIYWKDFFKMRMNKF